MSAQVRERVWHQAIMRAHQGDARGLLELLLLPGQTAAEAGFVALPDDHALRVDLVECLVCGPWAGKVSSLGELCTKTFPKIGKPFVSDLEVAFAELHRKSGATAEEMDAHAESLGIQPETLQKRIARRKRKSP
jgi:hypothetical protein